MPSVRSSPSPIINLAVDLVRYIFRDESGQGDKNLKGSKTHVYERHISALAAARLMERP